MKIKLSNNKIMLKIKAFRYSIINKKHIKKNGQLNNIEKGKECYILSNGPSLKNVNLNLLESKDVITVNQISRLDQFEKINIRYHFWADPMFFYEKNGKRDISDDMFEQMVKIIQHNKSAIYFVVSNPSNAVIKDLSKYSDHIYFYPCFAKTQTRYKFKLDLTKCCPSFNNVVQYAIYTAICLGYSRIYLLGCEQTAILNVIENKLKDSNANSYYGYKVSKEEKERMHTQFNKFPISTWFSQQGEMFKDFDWLNNFALKHGAEIYNCTDESLCDSFKHLKLNIYKS